MGVLVLRPRPPALFVENVAVLPSWQGHLRLYPALGYAETGRGVTDGFARVFSRRHLG